MFHYLLTGRLVWSTVTQQQIIQQVIFHTKSQCHWQYIFCLFASRIFCNSIHQSYLNIWGQQANDCPMTLNGKSFLFYTWFHNCNAACNIAWKHSQHQFTHNSLWHTLNIIFWFLNSRKSTTHPGASSSAAEITTLSSTLSTWTLV